MLLVFLNDTWCISQLVTGQCGDIFKYNKTVGEIRGQIHLVSAPPPLPETEFSVQQSWLS